MGKRDEALSLARDFERDGFRVSGLYEWFWRLQGDAAAYFTLADSLLRGRQEGGTLLKDAMGYVGEEDFKALIATAVEILREEAAQGRKTQQSKSAAQTEWIAVMRRRKTSGARRVVEAEDSTVDAAPSAVVVPGARSSVAVPAMRCPSL